MAKPYRTLRAQMAPEAQRQAEDKARALLAGDTPPPARPQPTLAEIAQATGLLGQPPYASQLAATGLLGQSPYASQLAATGLYGQPTYESQLAAQQAAALQVLQALRDAAAGLETPEGRA